jgi:hypothetical protein
MAGKRKRQSSVGSSKRSPEPYEGTAWEISYPRVGQKVKLSRIEKALCGIAAEQKSPFVARNQDPGALDIHYVIHPQKDWNVMRKYSNFISKSIALQQRSSNDTDYARAVAGDTYSNKEYVWVRPSEPDTGTILTDEQKLDKRSYWVAKVLEVRARDASHVYARVCWIIPFIPKSG